MFIYYYYYQSSFGRFQYIPLLSIIPSSCYANHTTLSYIHVLCVWNMCITYVYTCIAGVWITCVIHLKHTHVLHVYQTCNTHVAICYCPTNTFLYPTLDNMMSFCVVSICVSHTLPPMSPNMTGTWLRWPINHTSWHDLVGKHVYS